jgi:hypothetical protein
MAHSERVAVLRAASKDIKLSQNNRGRQGT